MKLKYILIMALAVLSLCLTHTKPAQAEFELADGKIKIGLNARVRYEFFNNTDFTSTTNDTRDYVLTRFRPTFTFLPHEQVSLVFQPQFSAGWGEVFGTSINSVNSAAANSTSGTLNDPVLGMHQAFMTYTPTEWFSMSLGRQEWAYGDQLLIGSVGWHNTGRAFDGIKMRFSKERLWVDVIYSLLNDAESGAGRGACAAPCTFGDHHFGGLYASWEAAEWLKAWDFYALYRLDSAARPRAHNYVTIGTRLKGKSNGWDYRLEATGQIGKSTATGVNANQRDYQGDLEVGYTWENAWNFRIGLEGLIASKNYIQMFPTAHKWLGFTDLFGRRNVMSGIVHLSMQPSEKWKLKLDAHTIMRNSAASSLFALNGTTAVGAGASTSKFAGEEIDFAVSFHPIEMLSFSAGINSFIPMGFVKTNVGSDLAMFGYLQTNLKF